MSNASRDEQMFFAADHARKILFVDPNVDSASVLLDGLHPGFEAVRLPEHGDPIAAIALHMAGRRDVSALHILSHGAPGELSLSGQRIDAAALAARPALTAAIRDALSADSEVVLYGCSVAQGRQGAAFVGALAALLDRPVAASAHPVGAQRLGGGWDIPARGAFAFDPAARAAYPSTLLKATFGIVTTINTVSTLTSNESGVTIDVTKSDSTPMAGVSSGFLDPGVNSQTVSYTLTFGTAVNVTQIQIAEFTNLTTGSNYVFTPNTGTAVTLADNDGTLAGSVATLTPTDWNGITSFTVSYAGATNWRVGLDNISFTSAVTTAAASNAGGFNTTNGTNLTPGLTFVGNDETLTIADASHITSTSVADGGAGTDTIVLATGSDLSTTGFTLSNFETVTLAAGASVTMTEAQHDAFTTINGNTGTEQITLATANGDGNVTGDADIETYVLGVTGFTFTLGAAAQNVTGSTGNDTINVGTLTPTGTLSGGTGTDVLSVGNGANISGATISGFETLSLASGASVTMTEAQHDAFSSITGAGTETITLSAATNGFQTASAIENYVLGVANACTIAGGAQNITGSTGNDTITFQGLTYTGTLSGAAGTDTIQMTSGTNISGATVSGVENLTLAGNASVTMTTAQLEAFTGTVTAAGTETVTLTTTGTVTNAGLSAIETVATAADTSAQTITMTAALASGKTLTAGDSSLDHFVITGSAAAQTIKGSGGADTVDGGDGDDVLSGGAGNDVLSGAGGADTISGGDGADVINGGDGFDVLVGGAGNDTFTSSSGNFNADTISDFAVGDSIVVTGSDLSSLNGTAASGSIAISGNVATTLTGVTAASGTFAASFTGGNTTITLVAPVVNSGGGGGSSDSGSSDSGSTSTIVVTPATPALSTSTSSQTITNTGTTAGTAAIVENSGNNSNVVTATLPVSVSITSEGPATAQSGQSATDSLVNAVIARGSTAQTSLVSGAQTFLTRLATTSTLDIRTLVPTTTSTVLSDPIIISGTGSSGQSEAFVIDVRSLPSGSTLQLDNIEFASIIGNATVNGGAGDNYVTGDDQSQFISLGVGNDTLYGGSGADTIGSGSGLDDLYGEDGDDMVFGGTEADNVFGGADQDLVYGNQAADVVYGNQGLDTLYGGQDNDVLYGGQHEDVLYGNLGNDTLFGNLGSDTLYGGQGDDVLYGGQNIDNHLIADAVEVLYGGIGNDTIYGGEGNDLIVGGDGNDLVVVQAGGGADTVSDFDGASGDRIQIEANANGTSIDTFAELQAAATTNASGNVEIALGGGNTLTLNGVTASNLQSDWFVFG